MTIGGRNRASRLCVVELEKRPTQKDGRVVYTGEADLTAVPLETGRRYYELRARIDRDGSLLAYSDFNSFAILPEAPANQYKPEEVLLHRARNWDNRFADYIKLTNCLGIRIAGRVGQDGC